MALAKPYSYIKKFSYVEVGISGTYLLAVVAAIHRDLERAALNSIGRNKYLVTVRRSVVRCVRFFRVPVVCC